MSFFVKYLSIAVIASIIVYGVTPILVNMEKSRKLVEEKSQQVSETTNERGNSGAEEVTASDPGTPGGVAKPAIDFTPSTDTIRPSGPDVESWGIVVRDAAVFEQNGKRREEKLAGGTLFEQVGTVKSSRGKMAKVRVWRGSSWAGAYLVSAIDLIQFEDGRDQADAKEVDDLCSYFALSSSLEQRKEELRQEAAGKNPYYADLKEAASAYNAKVEEAKRMTKERDDAKGAKRTQIADRLRRMEVENKKIAVKVQGLTKKYENWKKNNGSVDVSYDNDSRCRSILAEMEKIRPRLAVYGI